MKLADQIDLCEVLGRSEYRIPTAMRLPDDSRGYCSSLTVLFGDPNVDLRSGGLIGYPQIGQRLGLKQRQTERVLRGAHGAGAVRWFFDVPATNISTADEIIRWHDLDVSETRRQARLGRPPRPHDAAPGSTHLMMNQLIVETVVQTEQQGEARLWQLPGP